MKTIAVETAVQNASLAMLILRASLPQPDADLATVAPVLVVLGSIFPLITAVVCRKLYHKCCNIKDENEEVDSENGDKGKNTKDADQFDDINAQNDSNAKKIDIHSVVENGHSKPNCNNDYRENSTIDSRRDNMRLNTNNMNNGKLWNTEDLLLEGRLDPIDYHEQWRDAQEQAAYDNDGFDKNEQNFITLTDLSKSDNNMTQL